MPLRVAFQSEEWAMPNYQQYFPNDGGTTMQQNTKLPVLIVDPANKNRPYYGGHRTPFVSNNTRPQFGDGRHDGGIAHHNNAETAAREQINTRAFGSVADLLTPKEWLGRRQYMRDGGNMYVQAPTPLPATFDQFALRWPRNARREAAREAAWPGQAQYPMKRESTPPHPQSKVVRHRLGEPSYPRYVMRAV